MLKTRALIEVLQLISDCEDGEEEEADTLRPKDFQHRAGSRGLSQLIADLQSILDEFGSSTWTDANGEEHLILICCVRPLGQPDRAPSGARVVEGLGRRHHYLRYLYTSARCATFGDGAVR